MAAADYRLCDVCDQKAFYDSELGYEWSKPEYRDTPPFRIAGKEQFEDPAINERSGMRLGYLGDWAVLCEDCAKTHRTRIEPIVAARELDVEAERREPPALPRYLLDMIGEYGMARTDSVGQLEVQHRWETLIGGIKRYASDFARSAAQSTAPSNSPEFGGVAPAPAKPWSQVNAEAIAAQDLLDWNRSQGKRPIEVTKELGVARKAFEFLAAAKVITAAQEANEAAPVSTEQAGDAQGYRYPTAGEIQADVAMESTALAAAVSAMADSLDDCPLQDSLKVYAAVELAFKYGDAKYVEEVFREVALLIGLKYE